MLNVIHYLCCSHALFYYCYFRVGYMLSSKILNYKTCPVWWLLDFILEVHFYFIIEIVQTPNMLNIMEMYLFC